jgi:hypothetical protein
MVKWANYLITGAAISMIVPFILDYFELLHNHIFWPVLSIVLISFGVILHVINSVINHSINLQTIMLLLSVLIIVLGFSLVQMKVSFSDYLLLLGMILILIWLFLPNKKKQ